MAWYWIILIVIGYLLMWGISWGILVKIDNNHDEEDWSAFVALLWPVLICTIPFAIIVIIGRELIEKK